MFEGYFSAYMRSYAAKNFAWSLLVATIFGVVVSIFSAGSYIVGGPFGWILCITTTIVGVGAGICGPRFGLVTFFINFFVQLIVMHGDISELYPMFLHIIVIIGAGHIARFGWYKKPVSVVATAVISCAVIIPLYYLIAVLMWRSTDMSLVETIFFVLPFCLAIPFATWLYYRYMPDRIKGNIGLGMVYVKYPSNEQKSFRAAQFSSAGIWITLLSFVEAILLSVFIYEISEIPTRKIGEDVVLSMMGFEAIQYNFVKIEMFLIILTVVLGIVMVVNEIILVTIIRLTNTMSKIETELNLIESHNKTQTNFLSAMSHELRTPINAILGMDEMILRSDISKDVREFANTIQISGDVLMELIDDILEFSRLDSERDNVLNSEYRVTNTMIDVLTMVRKRAQSKNINLEINVDESFPSFIYGDEIRIRQVMLNLVNNAVKYTEEGFVKLSAQYEKMDGEHIFLTVIVEDSGIGIKEKDLDRLFEPFERLDKERNKSIDGTGLGIPIVKNLLGVMDSELKVESEYGKGSKFSFTIKQRVISWEPIGKLNNSYKNRLMKQDTYNEQFHAPDVSILVVDDTKINLTVVEMLLESTGIRVDVAMSGEAAIELTKKNKYDLIFMDHRMPHMDGIETFHKINNDKSNPNRDVPVIMLTANVIGGAKDMYLREGLTDYLAKPIDGATLEKKLMEHLPEDKVILPGDIRFIETEVQGSSKEQKQQLLKSLDGIDYEVALEACSGRPDILLEAVNTFQMFIMDNIAKIKYYLIEENYKEYTVLVHSIKSSARIIGAMELSREAEMLEAAGNATNEETIKSKTPEFLEHYRAYVDYLAPMNESDDADKKDAPVITKEELYEAFLGIKEFVQVFDISSADCIMDELSGYNIPDELKENYETLKRLLTEADHEGIISYVSILGI